MLLSVCISNVVYADSVQFTGIIKTQAPKVVINSTAIPISAVKLFEAVAEKEAGICELTTDPYIAQNGLKKGKRWFCLFEWVNDEGNPLNTEEMKQSGVFPQPGTKSLSYSVSIFSGGNKVKLYTYNYPLEVAAPVEPIINSIESHWNREKQLGLSQVQYDESEKLNRLTVNVEPRPFNQSVKLDNHSCTIYEGDSSCNLSVGGRAYGSSSEKKGVTNHAFDVTDTFAYWGDRNAHTYVVSWDYREPSIEGFVYNAQIDKSQQVVNIAGVELTLSAEEAALIVNSPHADKLGNWWIPKNIPLNLETVEGFEHAQEKVVNGKNVLFSVPNFLYKTKHRIQQIGEPDLVNGKLVYRYSTEKLPDGRYNVALSASDDKGNTTTKDFSDNLIDRFPPDIQVVMGERGIRDGTEVYFTDDVWIAANGGWNDGATITEVSVDGQPLSFSGDDPAVKRLSRTDLLTPNTQYDLVVKAQDAAGNEGVKRLKINYMPVEFALYGAPDELYAKSQTAKVYVTQKKGQRCSMASSPEIASKVSRIFKKGCLIEWPNLPMGMESIYTGSTYAVQGGINELGINTINYNVRYFNDDGSSVVVFKGSHDVNVLQGDPIQIQMKEKNKLGENLYGVDINGRIVSDYELLTFPAVTDVVISRGESEREIHSHSQRRGNKVYAIKKPVYKDKTTQRSVWDKISYAIEATHKRDPSSKVRTNFDVVTLPDRLIRAYIETEDTNITSVDTIHVTVKVGKSSRNGFEYNADTMGEWDVYLAYREGRNYVPFTKSVKLNSDGTHQFSVSAQELYGKSRTYYAMADVKSPYPEYTKQLRSSPKFVRIVKGTAVEGGISARRVKGQTPLSLDISYAHSSIDDRLVATNLGWEVSHDNGSTWARLSTFNGKSNMKTRLFEPVKALYRASVENKVTNEVTKTETIEVIAYDVPDIAIEGPKSLYIGQTGDYEVMLASEHQGKVISDVEWSIDDGESWLVGPEIKSLSFAESKRMQVRVRLDSTDASVTEDGWAIAKKSVSVYKPVPVRVSNSMPRIIEIGQEITLKGSAKNPYRGLEAVIESEWETPSGTIISGDVAQYTVLTEDIADGDGGVFVYRAWVAGYKDKTLAEKGIKTKIWQYTFPNAVLTLNSEIKVAPSRVSAKIAMPYVYAPGVEFGFEWVVDEEKLEVESLRDNSASFMAKIAGLHQIKVVFFDNRGNSREMSQFVDLVDASEMETSLSVHPSNDYWRVPLAISLKAFADPGHPKDVMESYQWFVDGTLVEGATSSFTKHTLDTAGTYSVKVVATSRMGQIKEITNQVVAIANQPPTCSPELRESISHVTVIANCSDSDGRIVGIRYAWNEVNETSGGSSLSFSKAAYPSVNLTIRAVDDSSESIITNIKW